MNTLSHHAPLGKPHYVYTLARPDGIVFYVGKGIGDRINDHEREAITNKTHNTHKVRTIKKIWREGGEIVKAILAYFETHEEAAHYEIALIFFMDGLTNLTRGGDGIVGLPRTAEHQRKIADAKRGQKATPETRQRLSIAHKKNPHPDLIAKMVKAREGKPNWAKGKKHSEEHRRKLSKAFTGRKNGPPSEETRRKIGEAHRGRKHSAEWRRNQGLARGGRPVKPFSEEHRRKISEAKRGQGKGVKQSPETIAKRVASIKKRNAEKRNMYQLEFPEMSESGNE